MWQFHAHQALDLANERRRQADEWRLASSVPRRSGPGPVRRTAARMAAAASRSTASLARTLDACSVEERRTAP
jgi:hypothetical protein